MRLSQAQNNEVHRLVHYHVWSYSALKVWQFILVSVNNVQGAVTQINTVLAAATGIKMTSFRRCTDVYGKLVACTNMHGNILFWSSKIGSCYTSKRFWFLDCCCLAVLIHWLHFDPGRGRKYSVYWSRRPLNVTRTIEEWVCEGLWTRKQTRCWATATTNRTTKRLLV